MRFSCVGVFSLLILGAASINVVRDEGTDYSVSVRALATEVTMCHLETPQNTVIKFKNGDTGATTDKFEILDHLGSSTIQCLVTIKNLDKADEGEWDVSFVNDEGTGRNQTYYIFVNELTTTSSPGAEGEENESNESIKEEENVEVLTLIEQIAREGSLIDISLDKKSFDEDCFLRRTGESISTDDVMENVLTQKPSKFVSCRVTIGPMTEDLLGEWNLCGRSVVDEKLRCQPVNIAWNNNNPTANWNSRIEPTFNHPVNLGSRVNPGVLGSANVLTCHVITPAGEHLVLKDDVKYPHIERIMNNPWLCSVALSDIDKSMLGDWTIYGRFRSQFTALHEVVLPFYLHLYNPNNPYEQAYNVTWLQETKRVVNLGNTVTVQAASSGQIDDCLYMTPAGHRFNLDNGTESMEGVILKGITNPTACQISIGPITKNLLGEWTIFGKFNNNNRYTEIRQSFHIIKEDPANPIIDDHRTIENLASRIVDTQIGTVHSFTINSQSFVNHESCHLRTPQGLQYTMMEGFNVPNVEVLTDSRFDCGVLINVLTEDMLGEWTLIARATRLSDPIERRLTFTIHAEETFSLGNPINIQEGADLYLRLPEDTHEYQTCTLYGPDDAQVTQADHDANHPQSCGFIMRRVDKSHNGTWTIVYGKGITYKGTVEVNVLETTLDYFEQTENWFLGSAVDKIVGPKDAVYCRLEGFSGNTIYEGFGACRIKLDRVTLEHNGAWKAVFGLPGAVVAQERIFVVHVIEADPIPVVTNVSSNEPSVLLTCSIPVKYNVTGCKFRDPRSNVLIASHNVGEEGFVFEGSFVNYESDAASHDCTLRLTNPTERDLGIWRCAVDTAQGTYYGFLDVKCPWIAPYDEYDITEPVLKQHRSFVSGLVGDAVQMSCSADAALKYCYFRSENGSVYSVGPATNSDNYEYVGNGLDAGECGIRIRGLRVSDSGNWSCNVGLASSEYTQELTAVINVDIQEKLWVGHFWKDGAVVVQSRIYYLQPIDYCRFVRWDGLGFIADNPPQGYRVERLAGSCDLLIERPNAVDRHPWTVAMKITGQDGEIQARTPLNFLFSPGSKPFSFAIFAWIMVTMFGLILMAVGMAMVPKKNREWTSNRVSRIRNSFRRATPPPAYTEEPVKRPEANPAV